MSTCANAKANMLWPVNAAIAAQNAGYSGSMYDRYVVSRNVNTNPLPCSRFIAIVSLSQTSGWASRSSTRKAVARATNATRQSASTSLASRRGDSASTRREGWTGMLNPAFPQIIENSQILMENAANIMKTCATMTLRDVELR